MFMCLVCSMQKHNIDDNNSPSKISSHIIRTEMLDDLFCRIILKTHSIWHHSYFVEAQIGRVSPNTLWMQTQNINPAALYLPIPESILTYNHKTLPWETKHDEKFFNPISLQCHFRQNSYLVVFSFETKLTQHNNNNISPFKNSWQQHYETQCHIDSRMTYSVYIILHGNQFLTSFMFGSWGTMI